MASPKKDFEEFEKLVADIQSQLSPDSKVEHNAKIPGIDSKVKRQVDIHVSGSVGQYQMDIAIECKDYKRKVDVKRVEEFSGLLHDIRFHKGVLVSASGFSNAAMQRAESLGIDLYRAVDTRDHKWRVKVTVPAVCDFREATLQFGLQSSAPMPMSIPYDFFSASDIFDKSGNHLGKILDTALTTWNNGGYTDEPGVHKELPVFTEMTVYIDNGYGTQMPVDIYVNMAVNQELYFGHLPITKISGFEDQLKGGLYTNAFELGLVSPDEVVKNWKRIKSEAEILVQPLVSIHGRTAYNIDDIRQKPYLGRTVE
ncbi:MAG: restriction endonuclease [Aquisalinus sp.]|nr:restriction endonuclease [Aquisalinus sp.]